ncbi:MAG TPA: hypothetical protein VFQ53_41780 [Kofleriaceae bacterium]|nr:hypothetical protein [Kofleriaceae bacterium]
MSTRPVTRTWYRVAIARPHAAPMLLAAEGEHLGMAIATAEHHVKGAYAIAAEVANSAEIPLGESVGKERVVEIGDAPELPTFHWPVGVIPSLAAPTERAEARRGYTIHDDPNLFVVEAQTEAEHLTDLFMGMIERLPTADNLEIRVLDHFEDAGTTDVYLTSRVDAKKILRFLDDHDDELFGNGHLETSIYIRKHKATLRLTEHKTVVWLSEDRTLETEVAGWLKDLAVPRVPSLVTITRTPHFHYRPAKSRDRNKLEEYLYRQRLRRVDTLRDGRSTRASSAEADT